MKIAYDKGKNVHGWRIYLLSEPHQWLESNVPGRDTDMTRWVTIREPGKHGQKGLLTVQACNHAGRARSHSHCAASILANSPDEILIDGGFRVVTDLYQYKVIRTYTSDDDLTLNPGRMFHWTEQGYDQPEAIVTYKTDGTYHEGWCDKEMLDHLIEEGYVEKIKHEEEREWWQGDRPERCTLEHFSGCMETAFSEQWKKRDKSFLRQLLEANGLGGSTGPSQIVTDRDRFIAGTLIQWLGTNVGRSFVEEAQREGKKLYEMSERPWMQERNHQEFYPTVCGNCLQPDKKHAGGTRCSNTHSEFRPLGSPEHWLDDVSRTGAPNYSLPPWVGNTTVGKSNAKWFYVEHTPLDTNGPTKWCGIDKPIGSELNLPEWAKGDGFCYVRSDFEGSPHEPPSTHWILLAEFSPGCAWDEVHPKTRHEIGDTPSYADDFLPPSIGDVDWTLRQTNPPDVILAPRDNLRTSYEVYTDQILISKKGPWWTLRPKNKAVLRWKLDHRNVFRNYAPQPFDVDYWLYNNHQGWWLRKGVEYDAAKYPPFDEAVFTILDQITTPDFAKELDFKPEMYAVPLEFVHEGIPYSVSIPKGHLHNREVIAGEIKKFTSLEVGLPNKVGTIDVWKRVGRVTTFSLRDWQNRLEK